MKRINKIAKLIGAPLCTGLVSLLTALVVVEGYLRLAGERPRHYSLSFDEKKSGLSRAERIGLVAPQLNLSTPHGNRLRPNAKLQIDTGSDSYTILTDANGCRTGSKTNNGGGVKLLLIGDSIALGTALPEKDTFSKHLEISARNQQVNLQTVNCAVEGLGTEEEVWRLREVIDQINPDLVILQFFLNDFQRSVYTPTYNPPRFLAWSWTARRVFPALSLIRHRLVSQHLTLPPGERETMEKWRGQAQQRIADESTNLPAPSAEALRRLVLDYFEAIGIAWSDGAWIRLGHELRKFHSVCRQRRKPMAVISFPISFQVDHPEWNDFPQKKLRTILEELQVPLIDLLPLMQGRLESAGEVFYPPEDPVHPNPLGHKAIASWGFDFLLQNFPEIIKANQTRSAIEPQ